MKLHEFMNIIMYYFEKFKTDAYIKVATIMLIGGLGLACGQTIFVTDGTRSLVYDGASSTFDYILALIVIIPALFIIYKKFMLEISKSNYLFYVSDNNFNTEDIMKRGFIPSKGRINLIPYEKKIDTYNQDEVIRAYAISEDNIKNRTMNKIVENTYIAGLGSFPHLFACGSFFGSAYASHVTILDYDRINTKWYTLPPLGEAAKYILVNENNTLLEDKISNLILDNSEDVGIAICNTFSIMKESIPEYLRDKTVFLEPNIGKGIDIADNKYTQDLLIRQLIHIMGELSNTKKRIHLFVSARASFCIKLGMAFMPRTHGTVILHNYNKDTKQRDWAIQLKDGKLKKYEVCS